MTLSIKAVFLDRDGVINKERKDYVKTPGEFELLPGVEKYLKVLVDNGFKLFIISNQSMIGKNLSTRKNLSRIDEKMQSIFRKKRFEITKIYYCLHRPEDNCFCRKPKTKLIEQAISEFKIDVNKSWLIGNSDSDMLAGNRVQCNTIKIKTNSSLEKALEKILKN